MAAQAGFQRPCSLFWVSTRGWQKYTRPQQICVREQGHVVIFKLPSGTLFIHLSWLLNVIRTCGRPSWVLGPSSLFESVLWWLASGYRQGSRHGDNFYTKVTKRFIKKYGWDFDHWTDKVCVDLDPGHNGRWRRPSEGFERERWGKQKTWIFPSSSWSGVSIT